MGNYCLPKEQQSATAWRPDSIPETRNRGTVIICDNKSAVKTPHSFAGGSLNLALDNTGFMVYTIFVITDCYSALSNQSGE